MDTRVAQGSRNDWPGTIEIKHVVVLRDVGVS